MLLKYRTTKSQNETKTLNINESAIVADSVNLLLSNSDKMKGI